MLMRSVNTYIGPTGARLDEMVLKDAATGLTVNAEDVREQLSENEPSIIYVGTMVLPIAMMDQHGNPAKHPNGEPVVRQQEVRFEIKASSPLEAFEKYEASANETYENILKQSEAQRQQAQQNKLVIPNAEQTAAVNNMRLVP